MVELGRKWQQAIAEPAAVPGLEEQIATRLQSLRDEKAAAFACIGTLRDEYISFLQELVRIPSVNPSAEFEKPLADRLAGEMRRLGMDVQQFEPHPNRVSDFGRYRGSRGETSLLFDAHLDTVAPGDAADWQFPPFSATIHDGRLYGRGSKDCKLGIAAAVMALRTLRECGIQTQGDILMAFTADEETGGHLGLGDLVQRGVVKADWAIYCEGMPDGVALGHWGWYQFQLTTRGKASHTARKKAGINAILQMCRVAPVLEAMTLGEGERPVASVNMIQGGFKENVVPDRCTITVDVRFPIGYTAEALTGRIDQIVAELKQQEPGLELEPPRLINLARPSSLSQREPIVSYLQASVREVRGETPSLQYGRHTSDTRWLLLDAGIPVVGYSCGNETGHMANEYVGLEDYIQNVKIYTLLCLLLLT
jgi:succinyl-diaminopimelate desuccinylase